MFLPLMVETSFGPRVVDQGIAGWRTYGFKRLFHLGRCDHRTSPPISVADGLAHGVERAGADIAIGHAKGGDRAGAQAGAVLMSYSFCSFLSHYRSRKSGGFRTYPTNGWIPLAKSAERRWAGIVRQFHACRRPAMSLKPDPIQPVPEATASVVRAVFRKGNPLVSLRDEFGAIFADADFADLFPKLGPAGATTVAAGAGHSPAVSRESVRPVGRRGGTGAHRLEVPARARAGRPWLRPLGAVRVPRAPAGGQRRGTSAA